MTETTKTAHLNQRMHADLKQLIKRCADEKGMTTTTWVEQALRKEAAKQQSRG